MKFDNDASTTYHNRFPSRRLSNNKKIKHEELEKWYILLRLRLRLRASFAAAAASPAPTFPSRRLGFPDTVPPTSPALAPSASPTSPSRRLDAPV